MRREYEDIKVWTIHDRGTGKLVTVFFIEDNVRQWFDDPRSHEIYTVKRSILRIPNDEKGGGE